MIFPSFKIGETSLSIYNHLFVALFVFVAIYLIKWFWAWRRLRHIPGPFWASFSNLWLAWVARRGTLPFAIKETTDEYGLLARVGLNTVVTANPDSVLNISKPGSGYMRSCDYRAARFGKGFDNMLSMRDEGAHKTLKAMTTAGVLYELDPPSEALANWGLQYTGKDVDGLEHEIDKIVEAFVKLIERKYLTTASHYRPVDLARVTQYFTLDVIMSVAFGKHFGHLESDSDVCRYIKMTESFMPVVAILLVYPWLCNVMESRFLNWLAPKDSDKHGMGKIMGVVKEVVNERFGPQKEVRKDMLGSFIAHGMTREEAVSETMVQIVAGSDTTATAIRAAFLHIITSPHIYAALRTEIDTSIDGIISSPITDAEARKLPYLQAVIQEGLRFWPPIGLLASKIVPTGGATINGFFVPEGTNIGVSTMGIQRSKSIFGDDADQFRPERWLDFGNGDAEKAREKKMRSTVDLVFASGRYTCPGRPVAMMELNKVFVELLRRYEFTLVNPSKPWTSLYAGVWLQKNLWVCINKRSGSLNL